MFEDRSFAADTAILSFDENTTMKTAPASNNENINTTMKTAPDSHDEIRLREFHNAASTKAVATRRKNEEEWKNLCKGRFLVMHEAEIIVTWEVNKSYRKPAAGVNWIATLENVVARLVSCFNPADGEDDLTKGLGFETPCLAVWNRGQLLAIVRRGPDGSPVGTIF